ncbi:hypothetical protein vseg_001968 [Gypsophila vaccaria]
MREVSVVVSKNFRLKRVAFFILTIFIILVSCQATSFMLDFDTIIIKEVTTNKKGLSTRKTETTTSSSLECKEDIFVCQEQCQVLGCFFTCIDDVGFSCLCHCDH